MMKIWIAIILIVVALLIGAVVGFFLSKKYFQDYLKKNPPMTEKMVRTMMKEMGRTPSEKQVRAVMRSMKNE